MANSVKRDKRDFPTASADFAHPREFSKQNKTIQWKIDKFSNERVRLATVNKCKIKSIELNIYMKNKSNWTYIMHLYCIFCPSRFHLHR